jgi:hypothetical protein
MTDAARELSRLVGALEDVVGQEATLFRAADYSGIRATQERAGPIITRLAEMSSSAGAAISARVVELIERRAALLLEMKRVSGQMSRDLKEVDEYERQFGRVAPVYAKREAPRSRLSVAI